MELQWDRSGVTREKGEDRERTEKRRREKGGDRQRREERSERRVENGERREERGEKREKREGRRQEGKEWTVKRVRQLLLTMHAPLLLDVWGGSMLRLCHVREVSSVGVERSMGAS
ncbi:unnamed protein product [Closterium sp. NIES-53]